MTQLSHIGQIYLFLHLRDTLPAVRHAFFSISTIIKYLPYQARFHYILPRLVQWGQVSMLTKPRSFLHLPAPRAAPIVGITPATPWKRSSRYGTKEHVRKRHY